MSATDSTVSARWIREGRMLRVRFGIPSLILFNIIAIGREAVGSGRIAIQQLAFLSGTNEPALTQLLALRREWLIILLPFFALFSLDKSFYTPFARPSVSRPRFLPHFSFLRLHLCRPNRDGHGRHVNSRNSRYFKINGPKRFLPWNVRGNFSSVQCPKCNGRVGLAKILFREVRACSSGLSHLNTATRWQSLSKYNQSTVNVIQSKTSKGVSLVIKSPTRRITPVTSTCFELS